MRIWVKESVLKHTLKELPMKNIDRKHWIHFFLNRGHGIVPLLPRSKKPAVKNWAPEGIKDRQFLARYFESHSYANYGVIMNEGLVVDADRKTGLANSKRLAEGGYLPETFTVKTPHGLHRYYACRGIRVGNSVGKLAQKVDVRGKGGYVVGPGCVNEAGDEYTVKSAPPYQLAEAPEKLLKRLLPKHENGSADASPSEPPSKAWLNAALDLSFQ